MLGTCWTALDHGDTKGALVAAVDAQSITPEVTTVGLRNPHRKTNLRLTGDPLQPYDLRRIKVAIRDA